MTIPKRLLDPQKHRRSRRSGSASRSRGTGTLRVKYLGRKGDLTDILRSLGKLDPEVRRSVGQEANRAKEALEGGPG